jgi:hypothetical protein
MAKLEIFIGYLGLTPQYHTIEIPFKSEVDVILREKSKQHFIKSTSKPTKFFGKINFAYKKFNKRSNNYEGTGLNKKT